MPEIEEGESCISCNRVLRVCSGPDGHTVSPCICEIDAADTDYADSIAIEQR